MPIKTMLDKRRVVFMGLWSTLGHSPKSSRASITCPIISPAVRFLTSFCVPVWQNEHVRVQPTWLLIQSVPLSCSGM